MSVALSICASTVVIFDAKRTRFLSALTNLIACVSVARIDNPTLILFCMNPGGCLIGWMCVELIALLFWSLVCLH